MRKIIISIVFVILAQTVVYTQDELFSRFWTVTCNNQQCKHAFSTSIASNCYGSSQCNGIIDEHFPYCSKCVNELLDTSHYETIGGNQYLVCAPEDELQVQGCIFYCRVNYYAHGVCVRQNNVPVCKCLPAETTQTTTVSHTTTTVQSSNTTSTILTTTTSVVTNSISNQSNLTLNGHTNVVSALAVLPNGELASGSYDGSIRIWNKDTGLLIKNITGDFNQFSPIYSLAVLPDGYLVSGSADGKIHIWNTTDYTLKKTLTSHGERIKALVVLRNGDLASASYNGKIQIWSPLNGTLKMNITHTSVTHLNLANALVVLQNGNLASGSYDRTIKYGHKWNISKTLSAPESIFSLAVLPNGDLVSGSNNGTISIWSTIDYTLTKTINAHSSWIYSLAIVNNGDLISGGGPGDNNTIKIWSNGSLKKTIIGHSHSIRALKVLPNGDLVSASDDTRIKIWRGIGV